MGRFKRIKFKSISLKDQFRMEQLYYNNLLTHKQITEHTQLNQAFSQKCLRKYKQRKQYKNKLALSRILKKFDFEPYENEVTEYIKNYIKQSRTKKLPKLSAKKITDYFIETHPEAKISFWTFRNHVMPLKKRLLDNNRKYIPLTHYPNEAQLDFGTTYIYKDEKLIVAYYMVLSFPHSNTFYCQLMRTRNIHEFIFTMDKILQYIKGVPPEIWFDNDAIFCHIQNKKRYVNKLFQRYMRHYKFKAVFLNVASGNEKGHVENYIRIARNNLFIPILTVNNLLGFNSDLFTKCDRLNKRLNNTGEIRKDVFDEDKKCFLPFKPFVQYTEKTVCIPDIVGRIKVLDKYYYLPLGYANKTVRDRIIKVDVEITRHNVKVYDKKLKEPVKIFDRLIEDDIHSPVTNWGPYLAIFSKYPEYVYTTKFFESLPYKIQDKYIFLSCLQKQEVLKNMSIIYEKTNFDKTLQVTSICLDGNRLSHHDFVMTIHNLKVDPFFKW